MLMAVGWRIISRRSETYLIIGITRASGTVARAIGSWRRTNAAVPVDKCENG
jgi:hypothetical protein